MPCPCCASLCCLEGVWHHLFLLNELVLPGAAHGSVICFQDRFVPFFIFPLHSDKERNVAWLFVAPKCKMRSLFQHSAQAPDGGQKTLLLLFCPLEPQYPHPSPIPYYKVTNTFPDAHTCAHMYTGKIWVKKPSRSLEHAEDPERIQEE